MLSINTNLSSLIAQSSMKTSTELLNQAVERMTTGFKINHAKDNAANYSISTNMHSQISSYDVAADNVTMGMDLVMTASDAISLMQDKAERLRALSTQARNGTYGASSISAINAEASSIMAEINRLYSTAEYNGINLFGRKAYEIADHLPKAGASGFIDESFLPATKPQNDFIAEVVEDTPDVIVTDPTQLATAISSNSKIGIGNAETLAKLAELVNSGTTCSGKTIILTEDIDLLAYNNWTPIGNSTNKFQGSFNGNGHVIKNLKIDRNSDYQGLLGCAESGEIKNIALEGVNIKGLSLVGGVVGSSTSSINNCNATGNVTAKGSSGYVGGLAGRVTGSIDNSYAICDVEALGLNSYAGGLAGNVSGSIDNSYAKGDVTGSSNCVGGLAASVSGSINNSYAMGDVTGKKSVAGLVASLSNSSTISDCYATGNVAGTEKVGGLVAWSYSPTSITNSYATGDVSGTKEVGGLVGYSSSSINNSYSTGNATGTDITMTGSFIGSYTSGSINNCQAMTQGIDKIGNCTDNALLANIIDIQLNNIYTSLQVGINSDSSNQLVFDTNFDFDLSAVGSDISSDSALADIDDFLRILSEKSTMLGAVQNRLDSALDSISVNIENLTSSLSTIRDADIAEVSSQYIQQQILQQAAATLMSTANQSPSIALQLI